MGVRAWAALMVLSDQIYAVFDAADRSAKRLHTYAIIRPDQEMDEAAVKEQFWRAYKTLLKSREAPSDA